MLTCLHEIASVRSPAARPMLAGLVCQAYSGLVPSYEVTGLSGHFHTSCHAHTMESFAVPCAISHFSMVTSSHLHPTSKIAPSATAVMASSPSAANRGAHQTLAGLVFGAHNGQHCNLILSSHRHGEFIAYVVMNTCSR